MEEGTDLAQYAKPLTVTTKQIPNYLWHLLAVGKIGYDSEYADRYGDTVIPEDLKLLKSRKSLLAFAEGEGGELAGLFSALPAWLPLEDEADLKKYFVTLPIALEQRSLQPVADAFPSADWHDRMWAQVLTRDEFPEDTLRLIPEAKQLGDIYLRNLDSYAQKVWPGAEAAMQPRIAELQQIFNDDDFIARWESYLGLEFAGDHYEFVLCYANKNGPDFNSLGYCGNLCYYDKPLTRTWQFMSHEIGTHILMDTFIKLADTGDFPHRPLYSAYECLAMFFNLKLLDVEKLDYEIPQFNSEAHLKFYSGISGEGLAPEEMIRRAVAAELL